MTTTIGNLMFRAAAGILGALTCAALAAAHDDNLQKLGKVSFATTCSAAAQPQFERGVALLYYERLVALTSTADTERPEVKKAKQFLARS